MRLSILSLLSHLWGCATEKYDGRVTRTRATESGNYPGYVEKWIEDKNILSISGMCRGEGFWSQEEAEKRLVAQKDALAANWQDKLRSVCGGRGYHLQYHRMETGICEEMPIHRPSGRNLIRDTAYFGVVCE